MTIKIYGRKSSCNVQKVLWLCSELEIDIETKDYGGKYGGTKEESYKALNPNSTVPLIDDDGFFLYESNAIIKYLSNERKSKLKDRYRHQTNRQSQDLKSHQKDQSQE